MKLIKRISFVMIGLVIAFIIAVCIASGILNYKTKGIVDDYSSVYDDPKYEQAILIDDIDAITQDVSCGYAVIEMFAAWNGNDVTEEILYDEYGKVVTSTGKSFCEEMNKQFPEYKTTMYKYLKNTELLDLVYDSLSNGKPVPFEWAAQYGDVWTLHYSLIVGMDIRNDNATIVNPYGYVENITLKELLERTSYKAFENMPLYIKLGFAFGIFEKNTIFVIE